MSTNAFNLSYTLFFLTLYLCFLLLSLSFNSIHSSCFLLAILPLFPPLSLSPLSSLSLLSHFTSLSCLLSLSHLSLTRTLTLSLSNKYFLVSNRHMYAYMFFCLR